MIRGDKTLYWVDHLRHPSSIRMKDVLVCCMNTSMCLALLSWLPNQGKNAVARSQRLGTNEVRLGGRFCLRFPSLIRLQRSPARPPLRHLHLLQRKTLSRSQPPISADHYLQFEHLNWFVITTHLIDLVNIFSYFCNILSLGVTIVTMWVFGCTSNDCSEESLIFSFSFSSLSVWTIFFAFG